MATARQTKHASIDDMYKSPGKAELVNGELVLMPPTGAKLGHAAIEHAAIEIECVIHS